MTKPNLASRIIAQHEETLRWQDELLNEEGERCERLRELLRRYTGTQCLCDDCVKRLLNEKEEPSP